MNDLWSFEISSSTWDCVQGNIEGAPTQLPRGAAAAQGGRRGDYMEEEEDDEEDNEEEEEEVEVVEHASVLDHNNDNNRSAGPPIPAYPNPNHPQVPSARFGYSAAMYNNRFILFGGYDGEWREA